MGDRYFLLVLKIKFYSDPTNQKVTISWLAKHVEVKHWIAVFMFVVAIFGTGIKVGSSTIYLDYFQPLCSSEKPKSNDL
jgi:hypothetical protein